MVPDHQVRRKWSGDASKKVQLFKVGGSRIIGTAVRTFSGVQPDEGSGRARVVTKRHTASRWAHCKSLPRGVKAQIPNRERGSGGDRNSLGVEANGQGSSNR